MTFLGFRKLPHSCTEEMSSLTLVLQVRRPGYEAMYALVLYISTLFVVSEWSTSTQWEIITSFSSSTVSATSPLETWQAILLVVGGILLGMVFLFTIFAYCGHQWYNSKLAPHVIILSCYFIILSLFSIMKLDNVTSRVSDWSKSFAHYIYSYICY